MNKPFIEKFAKNLKKLRKEKHLTQDDISFNGISRSMISLIELARTDVTITKLKIIADNMGIKVKDLFDFE
jgi:transcriptional regulator with XRE-family HTH domain